MSSPGQRRVVVWIASVLLAALSSRAAAESPTNSANRSNTPSDPGSHAGKLDAALRKQAQGPGERVQVIVTKERGHGLDSVAQAVKAVRGNVKQTLPNVSAVLADVSADKLLTLAASPSVHGVSLDALLQPVDGNVVRPPTASTRSDTLRDVLGLPPMNPAATDVGVAVIDSGLSSNADFAARITAFYDFTAGGVASAPVSYTHLTLPTILRV